MAKIDTSAEAVARMLEGVTPGPWRLILLDTDGHEFDRGKVRSLRGQYFGHAIEAEGSHVFLAPHSHADNSHDATFIAWARDAVPALAVERDRLAAQLTEARAAWEAFKGATVSDDHFAAVDRLDKALGMA
jgi:hypothetical protein